MSPALRAIDIWFIEEVLPHEARYLAQARRHLSNADQAADLVHDAYAQLYTSDGWQQIANPRAYVIRMVRNLAIETLRRERVVRFQALTAAEDTDHADDAPDAFDLVSGRQSLRQLVRAIWALPEHCREVVILRRIEDISTREIAERLQLSLSTVEKRLARGLFLLTKAMESESEPVVQPPAVETLPSRFKF